MGRSSTVLTGHPVGFRFPRVEVVRLATGLSLWLVRDETYPIVTLRLVTPAGGQHNPVGAEGLANATAVAAGTATTRREFHQIQRAVRGGVLISGATWDCGFVQASLLEDAMLEGLEVVAEVARSPSFPEDRVAQVLANHAAHVRQRRFRPRALAEDLFRRLCYKGTPYGNPLEGTEQGLGSLRSEDLRAFHTRHWKAAGSTLVAVGRVRGSELETIASRFLGALQDGEPLPDPPLALPPLPLPRLHVIDVPGAVQTHLILGRPGLRVADDDFTGLSLLTGLLGGSSYSRLQLELRQRLGITYSIQASLRAHRGPGPLSISGAVDSRSVAVALREIVRHIRELRTKPVPRQELAMYKDHYLAAALHAAQTHISLAGRLAELAALELPASAFQDLPEILASYPAEQLARIAADQLDIETWPVVAVGPGRLLLPQLESFGPVQVHAAASD